MQLRTELWRHVIRQQFPLVPALSDTVHSTQGSSYDKACVEYYDGMENKMVYVGFSRVRTLAGLYISESTRGHGSKRAQGAGAASAPKLFNHPRLNKKYERLAKEKERLRSKPIEPWWAPLEDRPDPGLRVVYRNVQSLNAHHQDVTLGDVFMKAGVLLLAETWLRPGQQVELGRGMTEVARCDSPALQGSAAGGVAEYSKLPMCQDQVISPLPLVEAASARQGDILLVAVMYCHPKAQQEHILEALDALLSSAPARTTILAADFNTDMQSAGGRQITAALEARGLTSSSNRSVPTTYNSTTIDVMFSTAPEMTVTQYQSYYSSHIPMVADI
ncbi:hypothetical protein KUF71_022525 [Frankliniella fusca]|uniref:Endonuclease/exonuclease/phosphatase domain-containing protein n=1 Tax=Frankliniella fusca TaxID=407009 RepID=A0AAE1LAQ2_9NEOP|nr:hypothetical protein KUF71_022525 [Frankliniella fusca]